MKERKHAGKVDAAPLQPSELIAQHDNPEAHRVKAKTCRALLNRPNLTDEEAEEIVEHLYGFANVCVDVFTEKWHQEARESNVALSGLDDETKSTVVSCH
jgi:hypothetical protein